jgi:hypothetical protein
MFSLFFYSYTILSDSLPLRLERVKAEIQLTYTTIRSHGYRL